MNKERLIAPALLTLALLYGGCSDSSSSTAVNTAKGGNSQLAGTAGKVVLAGNAGSSTAAGGNGTGGSSGGTAGKSASGGTAGASTAGKPSNGGQGPGKAGQSPGNAGAPSSCSADTDCQGSGNCPPDATLGCMCGTTGSGKRCVPKCTTATDCPKAGQTCNSSGFCTGGAQPNGGAGGTPGPGGGGQPPNGGAGPVACSLEADCQVSGACPADATQGCSCATTPSGKNCVPKCTLGTDCHADQSCTGGVCVQNGSAGMGGVGGAG